MRRVRTQLGADAGLACGVYVTSVGDATRADDRVDLLCAGESERRNSPELRPTPAARGAIRLCAVAYLRHLNLIELKMYIYIEHSLCIL